jgi:cytochrome c oxidase assembly protein Cox11
MIQVYPGYGQISLSSLNELKQAFPLEAPVCFIADNDMVKDIDTHNLARLG